MDDSREPDLPGVRDDRTRDVQRMDYMRDQIIEVTKLVREVIDNLPAGNTQTVIHKTQGMGIVGVICATVCVMCVVILILGAIIFVPDLHDLKAWIGIQNTKIAKLEAQQEIKRNPN